MLESIGGGGDAGLGDAALVDSVYGLNALRAMSDASRLAGNVSNRAMDEAAAASAALSAAAAAAASGPARPPTGPRAAAAVSDPASEAVKELLPATVELSAVAAGVATALEHLPASLRETDPCIGLLLAAAAAAAADPAMTAPGNSGAVRIAAARRLLRVTARALEVMDLGEIGSDTSLPGFAAAPQASAAKLRAAAATGIKKFLNRLLAQKIETQVVVFAFFMACLEAKVAMARRAGTFDSGVSTLAGTLVPEAESEFGAVVPVGAAATANANAAALPDELFRLLWRERQPPHRELRFVELRIDRGVSFEDAVARLRAQLPKPHPRARTGFFISRRAIVGSTGHAVLLALVRGYSAPVGAAAEAAAAADAAAAAEEAAARKREEEGEEEEVEEIKEEGGEASARAPALAAAAGLQVVGAGNNNFYSAAQQHQHRLQQQQTAPANASTVTMPHRPPPASYQIIRPNTGSSVAAGDMSLADLMRIYEPLEPGDAEHYWRQIYERTERGCAHGPGCRAPNCRQGTR